jgi:aminopeptidase N
LEKCSNSKPEAAHSPLHIRLFLPRTPRKTWEWFGEQMKLGIFSLTLLLMVVAVVAQVHQPGVDKSKLAEEKEILYEQAIRAEKQITENQKAYDVTFYVLDLEPDPYLEVLNGRAEIHADITGDNLDRVELNFWDGMTIKTIHSGSQPAALLQYARNNDLLTILLDRSYRKGEQFVLNILYSGQPQNSPYGSFDFGIHNDQPMIWTLSQPFGSRAWWPCKDVTSDKADSVDIIISVPNDLIVASNGTLVKKEIKENLTTYVWQERYPIVTYLVFLAIHPFTVYEDQYRYNHESEQMPICFYLFEENYERLISLNAKTKDMIAHFADLFGEYPFVREKYGHADFLGGGAMEHQTCSSFSFWDEWVVAHELAHQWWGDLITCTSFNHIWLNEGFATYCEALWYEYLNGPGTASAYQMSENFYLGPGTVYVEDPENETIFHLGLSYSKGSWVLHMLRHVVGDDIFFDILKTYYASRHRYATAATEEFQAICENVSGKDLDKFFHQWIYEEGYPLYYISWEASENAGTYDIILQIEQKQANSMFWMPLDIAVTTVEGETTLVVTDSLASQNFKFSVNAKPMSIKIDPDNWVLKTVQEKLINPTFSNGILLVNGINFDSYGEEIKSAYAYSAFWGDFQISFWDCFETPLNGYPETLPAPLGHGPVPADILGKFSTLIWLGNNFEGDINAWYNTSVNSYLESGGNIILLTRMGREFLDENLRSYLNITWAEQPTNLLNNCIAVNQDLFSMSLTGTQSLNAVFDETLTNPESQLLFSETVSFNSRRGLGVWKKPAAGGIYKNDGGQFVFISGRPYRYDHQSLRNNISFILKNFFNESFVNNLDESASGHLPRQLKLKQNYPNPFNPETNIHYELPTSDYVNLKVHNILGQEVVTLVSEQQPAGVYQVAWDAGAYASGIYFYRLQVGASVQTRKLVLLK